MDKAINLLSFNLQLYKFDIEKIASETGVQVRYVGIPLHDSDATMLNFFTQAYPTMQFENRCDKIKQYIQSDATPMDDFYIGATCLSYKDAYYLPQRPRTSIESTRFIRKIEDCMIPGTFTLLDLPQIAAHDEANKNDSAYRQLQMVETVLSELSPKYRCIAVSYTTRIKAPCQNNIEIRAGENVPRYSWKSGSELKVDSITELLSKEEADYQDHLITLIKNLATGEIT